MRERERERGRERQTDRQTVRQRTGRHGVLVCVPVGQEKGREKKNKQQF